MNWITPLFAVLVVSRSAAFLQTPLPKHSPTINTSHHTPRPPSTHTTLPATLDPTTIPQNSSTATSSLISNLATIALKLRLANQSSVSCHANASSSKLLRHGTVGPVTVKGRGWESPLGLTCKVIEASVDECVLDRERMVRDRKLVLVTPAVGRAMVALDGVDFGNFVTHPLVSVPDVVEEEEGGRGGRFKFRKEGVEISSGDGADGIVVFNGDCLGEGWRCELRRQKGMGDSNRAVVDVKPLPGQSRELSEKISAMLSNYFNKLVFELDGTYLTFRDLVIHTSSEITNKSHVLIALDIKVCKFPSPGAPF